MEGLTKEALIEKAEQKREELKKLEDAGRTKGVVYDYAVEIFNSYKIVVKDLFGIRI